MAEQIKIGQETVGTALVINTAGGGGQSESQVNSQIDAIRTSGSVITFPNGQTFTFTDTDTQLTASTILGILNAATGNIDGDLLANAPNDNTQLTVATILGILNGASGSIDADLLGNAPDTNTQLTASTILAILNAASGSIDGDLLSNATDTQLTQAEVQTLQLQPIPNTDTQLTAGTILGILNAADGDIDADLLTLAPGGGGGQTETQVNTQIDSIRTSSSVLTFPNGQTFTGGTGGTGDVVTLNFALVSRFTDDDAPRTYCTIIEPTGAGTTGDMANWRVVQNFRSTAAEGRDANGRPIVMTRTYTFTDVTSAVAYQNRDTIRSQRANSDYDPTQLAGHTTGDSTYITK